MRITFWIDDAFLSLKVVDNKNLYIGAENTYPHTKEFRVKDVYPKDSYHIACNSHISRIQRYFSLLQGRFLVFAPIYTSTFWAQAGQPKDNEGFAVIFSLFTILSYPQI